MFLVNSGVREVYDRGNGLYVCGMILTSLFDKGPFFVLFKGQL